MCTKKQAAAKARIHELKGRLNGLKAQWGRFSRPSSYQTRRIPRLDIEHSIMKLSLEIQFQHHIELTPDLA